MRENGSLTQEALAEGADLHRTYISQLERARKSPTQDVLVVIAGALGVTLKQFLSAYARRLDP